ADQYDRGAEGLEREACHRHDVAREVAYGQRHDEAHPTRHADIALALGKKVDPTLAVPVEERDGLADLFRRPPAKLRSEHDSVPNAIRVPDTHADLARPAERAIGDPHAQVGADAQRPAQAARRVAGLSRISFRHAD